MTREEAIEKLELMRQKVDEETYRALILAIKALEQEPCDDAISREATVKRLCKVAEFMNEKREGLGSPYIMAALFIQDNKEEFPSVTPSRRKGHWIKKEDDTCWWYVCSECEQEPLKNRWNDDDVLSRFCPNCGAKMESEDKE